MHLAVLALLHWLSCDLLAASVVLNSLHMQQDWQALFDAHLLCFTSRLLNTSLTASKLWASQHRGNQVIPVQSLARPRHQFPPLSMATLLLDFTLTTYQPVANCL